MSKAIDVAHLLPAHCPCGMESTKRCRYRLGGRKAGEMCGRPLCANCATPTGQGPNPGFCPAHATLAKKTGQVPT